MIGYMISPLGLTTEELEIYRLLYEKVDFDSMMVKYTVEQLSNDSNIKLSITKKKASLIIKKFIESGFLETIRKGSKGNPTIYKIVKIQDLEEKHKSNLKETQKELKGNINETNKPSNINSLEDLEKRKGNINETQRELKGNTKVNPINEKEKEKENIYIDEKEIFDYWNSRNSVIHSQDKTFDKEKTKIKTAIKTYGKDEILKAIERLCDAINDDNYYYNFQWNLFKFLKQSNGISNWLDDGQLWNNYNKSNNSTYKPNNQQVKRYAFDENPF